MSSHRGKIILLPPNRVWRTYPGGKTLDALAGVPAPADSHLAEDWIASTTRAVNPAGAGDEPSPAPPPSAAPVPGLSLVRIGLDQNLRDFAELLASDPEYFLGATHVLKYGAQPQLLVKFLDSGTRLHFQVHPTRDLARSVLGAPSGKTEAYFVLGIREEATPSARSDEKQPAGTPHEEASPVPPATSLTELASAESSAPHRLSPLAPRPDDAAAVGHIFVGFQRPPTPAQLRTAIVTQDIATIESWFDPIAVRPGDTFIIPGGTPHALGAGIFLVEIQEPSDLVVRFEFERAGYVLPEASRFMNRNVDFALTVFNLDPLTPAGLDARIRCRPRRLRDFGSGSFQDELIGVAQTDCFRVRRTRLAGPVVKDENSAVIAIVTAGAVTAAAGGETHRLDTYEKFFLPAGIGPVTLSPCGDMPAEILECLPPA